MTNKGKMSFYKIYEKGKNNRKIFKGCRPKSDKMCEGSYLRGVSCFVIDENGDIIVETRGNTSITKGKLDLCSGHIDNNETATQAMVREYVEELHNGSNQEEQIARNEAISNLKKLDELDLVFEDNEKKRRFFIQFYALKTKLNNFKIQQKEVEKIAKIPMEELFELIRKGKTKFPYDKRFEKIFKQVKEIYEQKNFDKEKQI